MTDSQKRHTVNGWLSSKLHFLKLGTEFFLSVTALQMSTLEAK